jgi:hypothetical protein
MWRWAGHERVGARPAPETYSGTDKDGKWNPNAAEFIPTLKPQSSSGVGGVIPGLRIDQKFICPLQMTPKIVPSVSLIGVPLILRQRPNEAMEGALQSDDLTQDSRGIGPPLEAREPLQALPATANLHINLVNLVSHKAPARARGDV